MVSNVLIFTPIWGWFPFWRAYFSNELKPPHRWDFNKTIIRIPMFHNQFLKANFCPQQTRVTKKWSRWRLVCLRLSPSATATWNLAYNRMSCIQPVAFFGVGKKKTTSGGRFPVSKKKSSKVYTPVFFFMLCLFNVFFPKQIRVVHQQFHKKAGQIDVCWWSFIRGDGDVDSFFPLTFWWFWGASRTRRFKSSSQKKYCP